MLNNMCIELKYFLFDIKINYRLVGVLSFVIFSIYFLYKMFDFLNVVWVCSLNYIWLLKLDFKFYIFSDLESLNIFYRWI